jgi:CRISPR-associated endonuclease/helicase Cas3
MNVTGYTLPLVQYPDLSLLLHPHQAVMLDEWNQHDAFLLVTKTGSGKTAATALPVAFNRGKPGDNCVVFVYPTNELIRDQARSIYDLLTRTDRLGLKVKEITPENANDPVGDEEIVLVRVDADLLTEFCKVWGMMRHGQPQKAKALERLLSPYKAKIVLTNPDTLYLLYSLRYGKQAGSVLGQLQAFQTIVFDEFHLYNGVELAHVLYLIYSARKFGAFKRVVLLSATPHPQVLRWIERLLHPREITMQTPCDYPQVMLRQVAHDVQLTPLPAHRDPVGIAFAKVMELLPRLRQLRAETTRTDYVPAVVILNSVVKAIELEDRLRAAGISQAEIVPIRGMSSRQVRQLRPEQLLVVGTSAIEVGIDFQCDYLLFEASDAASFMQRFGRLGRHQPGEAFLISTERECAALLAQGTTLSRSDLEEAVAQTYPHADARAWFVSTELGAFAALTQAFNIREQVWQDKDRNLDAEATKEQVFEELKTMMNEYGDIMQIGPQVKRAQRIFWSCKRGTGQKWVDDYLKIDSFRTSLPSIEVHDLAEARRRGMDTSLAKYTVDVKSLLTRASGIWDRRNRLEIDGYGKSHWVAVNKGFRDEEVNIGVLLTTGDYPNLMLTRDGELESCSHVMSRLGTKHTFVFVPYDDVRDALDWRLASFPCGTGKAKFVLAFDGDALLLKEIWRKAESP